MKNFFVSAAMLLVVATSLIAQDEPGQILEPVPVPPVQVVTGTYLTADDVDYQMIDGRVQIFAVGLDKQQKQTARLKIAYDEGWVFVYNQTKPYPPKISLLPAPVEIGKPGVYDIQVLPIVNGKGIPSVFIEGVNIAGVVQPDPAEPSEPPVGDFENLANLSKDLAILVGDPDHARKYLNELEKVSFTGDLETVKRSIGSARAAASVGGVQGQWYKFFQPLDNEISKATTVGQYRAMWDAVIQGLKTYLSNSTQSTPIGFEDHTIVLPVIYSNEPARLPVQSNDCFGGNCLPVLR